MATARQENDDMYDEEAFLGNEEGEIIDGRVLDDLDDEDNDGQYDDDEDDDGDEDGDEDDDKAGEHADMEAQPSRPALPDAALQTVSQHTDAVVACSWCGAAAVVTGGCDDVAFVTQLGAGDAAPLRLEGHEDTVAAVAYDPTQNAVATGGMDGVVRVWDATTGECVGTLDGPGEAIVWLQWHPKGTILLAGSEDMTAWMWNAPAGQCMQVFSGHSGFVSTGGFTPDGKLVVTAGGEDDGSLRVWNPKSGECTATIMPGHGFHDAQGITCIAFAAEAGTVATGGVDGAVVISSATAGRAAAKLEGGHEDSVEALAFAPGLNLLVSAGLDGQAIIWDTGVNSVRTKCAHPEGVVALAMQRRGPLFATGCLDGVVRVWDVRSAACVAELGGHSDVIQQLAWSPDDCHLLSVSDDRSARIFQVVP